MCFCFSFSLMHVIIAKMFKNWISNTPPLHPPSQTLWIFHLCKNESNIDGKELKVTLTDGLSKGVTCMTHHWEHSKFWNIPISWLSYFLSFYLPALTKLSFLHVYFAILFWKSMFLFFQWPGRYILLQTNHS